MPHTLVHVCVNNSLLKSLFPLSSSLPFLLSPSKPGVALRRAKDGEKDDCMESPSLLPGLLLAPGNDGVDCLGGDLQLLTPLEGQLDRNGGDGGHRNLVLRAQQGIRINVDTLTAQ